MSGLKRPTSVRASIAVSLAAIASFAVIGIAWASYEVALRNKLEESRAERILHVQTLARFLDRASPNHSSDLAFEATHELWSGLSEDFPGAWLYILDEYGHPLRAADQDGPDDTPALEQCTIREIHTPAGTIALDDLAQERGSADGYWILPDGGRQLISVEPIESSLGSMLAIGVRPGDVEREVLAAAAPWLLGMGAIALIVIPGSSLLLVGAYRRAQRGLDAASRELQDLTREIPEIIFRTTRDPDGSNFRYLQVSGAVEEMLEVTPEQLMAEPHLIQKMYHPDDAEPIHRAVTESSHTGDPVRVEHRIITPSGKIRWFRVHSRPTREDDGSLVWNGVATDITEIRTAQERVTQSEGHLRTIADALPGVVYQLSVDAENNRAYTYISDGVTELTGLSADDMYADRATLLDLVVEADKKNLYTDILRADALRGMFLTEFRIKRASDGEIRWIQVRSLTDAIGNESFIVNGLMIDVTDRAREQELRDAQREILELIATSDDLVPVLERLGSLVESMLSNSACAVMLTDDEGETLSVAAAPSLDQQTREQFNGLRVGPRSASCGTGVYRNATVIVEDTFVDPLWEDYREVAHDLEIRACWSSPFRGDGERAVGTFAICRSVPGPPDDFQRHVLEAASSLARIAVTHHRQRESINQSEERLRRLVAETDVLLWEFDPISFRFTYVSPRAKDILGYEAEEWYEEGFWLDKLHDDDRAWAISFCQERCERHEDHEFEYRMRHADGRYLWLRDAVNVVLGADGEISHLRGVIVDITELRTAQEDLRASNRSLNLLFNELDHRVKNSLAGLLSLVEMGRRSASNLDAFADAISSRVRAMASTHTMLSQSGGARVEMRSLITSLVRLAEVDRVEVSGPEVGIAPRQATPLGLVIQELITNSIKHGALSTGEGAAHVSWSQERTSEGLRVTLEWRETGGQPIEAPSEPKLGLRLVRGLTESELAGSVEFGFEPRGIRHVLTFTLDSAGAMAHHAKEVKPVSPTAAGLTASTSE